MYTVCCDLALVDTQVEDVPVQNGLVEQLAEDPTRDRTLCDLTMDLVNPVSMSIITGYYDIISD